MRAPQGWAVALVAAAIALSGCSPDKGFSTKRVERADYGAEWPLESDSAVLACEPGGVLTLTVDGVSQGIGQVDLSLPRSERVAHYMTISSGDRSSADYSVFIAAAMDLCD